MDGTGEAYRHLGRPEEAITFHRLASTTQRELGDRWQLALSLDKLAEACLAAGDRAGAHAAWQEAARVTEGFEDPAAERLHRRARRRSAP
jgi:predicted Zn-dependent protease